MADLQDSGDKRNKKKSLYSYQIQIEAGRRIRVIDWRQRFGMPVVMKHAELLETRRYERAGVVHADELARDLVWESLLLRALDAVNQHDDLATRRSDLDHHDTSIGVDRRWSAVAERLRKRNSFRFSTWRQRLKHLNEAARLRVHRRSENLCRGSLSNRGKGGRSSMQTLPSDDNAPPANAVLSPGTE